jgi:hypothetical protein
MKSAYGALCTVLVFALSAGVTGTTGAQRSSKTRSRSKPASKIARGPFTLDCDNPSFPSPEPATNLGIDKSCGSAGSGTAAEAAQNKLKNNFCAAGEPSNISFSDMKDLQQQVEENADINFGNHNSADRKKGPTDDRSPLADLGEGKQVVLTGYVLISRQEGGESVNCGSKFPPKNPRDPKYHDIHISLVPTQDVTNECSSVVAEMSPHHRPDSWNRANVQKVASAGSPVRVTGQLFFDSSHVPCDGAQPSAGNPKRFSLWEIHPIYKFEVCTANCNGTGDWVPLDEWVAQDDSGK